MSERDKSINDTMAGRMGGMVRRRKRMFARLRAARTELDDEEQPSPAVQRAIDHFHRRKAEIDAYLTIGVEPPFEPLDF